MSLALIKAILIVRILYPGGQLACPPTSIPSCTYYVRSDLAYDLIQDPWGGVEVVEWSPQEYIIGQ